MKTPENFPAREEFIALLRTWFEINSLSELPATETLVPPKEEAPMIAIDSEELSDDEGGILSEAEAD